ncbi:MAG TPA: phosphatase PAP2 family protein [Ramlibacter sp.]|nr:phosphatase PAP2 family protein [Ramlibacter sp.]
MRFRAVALGALLLFGLLAAQVLATGELTRIDRAVTLFLASHRQGWLTQLTLWTSELHETVKLLAATALVAAGLAWRGHAAWAWRLGAVPTGMLLNVALKHLFQRARPQLDEPLVQLATYSFPSGHGMASTVFYGSLALLVLAHTDRRVLRVLAVLGAVAMIAWVCFCRVYLGAHHVSDVLAAVCVGVAWLVLWGAAVGRFAPPERSVA